MYNSAVRNNSEETFNYPLESTDEGILNSMAELIASVLGTSMAGICFLDGEQLVIIGQFGMAGVKGFKKRECLCQFTLLEDSHLKVNSADLDSRFANSSCLKNAPFIKSYLGVPLNIENLGKIGTLFVADSEISNFSNKQINLLKAFSKQVESSLSDKLIKNSLLERDAKHIENLKYFVHDLKNPMTIVKTSLELIKGRMGNEEDLQNKLISRCTNNLMRIFLTLDELLCSESMGSIEKKIEIEKVNLKELIYDSIENIEFLISGNQKIINNLNTFFIETNKNLLKRIVENIVSNSIKYGQGSDIQIDLVEKDNNIEIQISDEGCGIAEGLKEKVFELGFKQGHTFFSSHGIGLHFCREASRSLGGDINFIANKPKGTTFIVTLPLSI